MPERNIFLPPGQLFFEYSPDIVLVLKLDGKIQEVNPAAAMAYGYSKEELLLFDIYDLSPISIHSGIKEQLKAAEKGGIFIESVQQSKEGKIFPVEIYLQPFQSNKRLLLLATIRDISRWREERRKKERLKWLNKMFTNIFMNLTDGAIIIDKDGRITDVNTTTEKMLREKGQKLQGKLIGDVLGIKTPYTNEMLRKGKPYSEVELILEHNNNLHLTISGNPVKDENGEVNGGILFIKPFEDIHNLVNRFGGKMARFYFRDIITRNENVKEIMRIARQAAENTSIILLEGESGTGKEVFAQAIHNESNRKNGPFVAVNCGAIPRELVGSEIFGYTDGAFTGARKGGRPGKFELATGGTLFLDEIGDMPLEQQVALLRVLQEKTITRVGGNKVIPIDVRVICATNKNLWGEVEAGNFRADLYYRLNVISIQIPPLRSRKEDIPLLYDYFLDDIMIKSNKVLSYDEDRIMKYLIKYDWPGNIRELQNVVERMVSMAHGHYLSVEHLPPHIRKTDFPRIKPIEQKKGMTLYELQQKSKQNRAHQERQQIISLLEEYQGNISRVAKEMGYNRSTIYRKMKNYHINK